MNSRLYMLNKKNTASASKTDDYFKKTVLEYYSQKNWNGLLFYLKALESRGKLPDPWKWQLASVLNRLKKPSEAIDYIYPMHSRYPEQPDIQLVLLESLSIQNRPMDGILWVKKPQLRAISEGIVQKCYYFIAQRKKPVPLYALYHLLSADVTGVFDEFDLLVCLRCDGRFFIINSTCFYRYSQVDIMPHQMTVAA